MMRDPTPATLGAILRSSTGRRAIMYFALFLAMGVGAMMGRQQVDGAGGTVLAVLGVILVSAALLMLVYLPMHLGILRYREDLLQHGVPAIGTVLSVAGNDVATDQSSQRVKLRLRVKPTDGTPPFEAVRMVRMSRMEPFYPGQRHPMWYRRETPYHFLIGAELTYEESEGVRWLFALASFGEADQPGSDPESEAGDPTA